MQGHVGAVTRLSAVYTRDEILTSYTVMINILSSKTKPPVFFSAGSDFQGIFFEEWYFFSMKNGNQTQRAPIFRVKNNMKIHATRLLGGSCQDL